MSEEKKQALIDRIAAYVMSHHRVIKEMDTHDMTCADTGLRAALKLFMNDPTAADDFLAAIGSDFEVAKRPEGTYLVKDGLGRTIGTISLNDSTIPNNIMNGVAAYDLNWVITESNTGNEFHHFIFSEAEPEDD